MSIKRSLIKNTFFNLGGYFYLLLASFFSISIILGNLGREKFGVYIFLASFISISSVFEFGISSAVVRRLSLPTISKDEKISVWKTSFSLFLFISSCLSLMVMGILVFVTRTLPMFRGIDQTSLNWSIFILTAIVFINHINTHFLSLPQAEQRFDIFNSKTFLVGTANTVLSAIVSGFYPNFAVIFLTQLIFHLVTLIFLFNYASRIFPGNNIFPKYKKSEGRGLISFGLKNFAGTLANQIDLQFSTYTLGAFSSPSAITAFNIPQNIVLKGAGIVSQISQVVFPLSSSLLEKNRIGKLKKLVLSIQGITFLGGILAIILSFSIGKPFLLWWLKDEIVVEMAYPVLKIMSIYFLFNALTPIPSVILQSIGKPQVASFFAILTTVIDAIAMIILIPKLGAMGAAYSTLLSSIITVPAVLIVTWILFNREVKKTIQTT